MTHFRCLFLHFVQTLSLKLLLTFIKIYIKLALTFQTGLTRVHSSAFRMENLLIFLVPLCEHSIIN